MRKNKLWIVFVIAALLFIKFTDRSSDPKITNAEPTKKYSSKIPQMRGLEGIDYSFRTLSPDTVKYLKESKNYGKYYKAGKKFIIYFKAGCPYAGMMVSAMKPIKNSEKYRQEYNFYGKRAKSGLAFHNSAYEYNAVMEFDSACSDFCIVNPRSNTVFGISGIGEQEASSLKSIVRQLKDW